MRVHGPCAVYRKLIDRHKRYRLGFSAQAVVFCIRDCAYHLICPRRILRLRHHLHQAAQRLRLAEILSTNVWFTISTCGASVVSIVVKPRPVTNGIPIVAK